MDTQVWLADGEINIFHGKAQRTKIYLGHKECTGERNTSIIKQWIGGALQARGDSRGLDSLIAKEMLGS